MQKLVTLDRFGVRTNPRKHFVKIASINKNQLLLRCYERLKLPGVCADPAYPFYGRVCFQYPTQYNTQHRSSLQCLKRFKKNSWVNSLHVVVKSLSEIEPKHPLRQTSLSPFVSKCNNMKRKVKTQSCVHFKVYYLNKAVELHRVNTLTSESMAWDIYSFLTELNMLNV